MKRTGTLGDLISWEDGVYGNGLVGTCDIAPFGSVLGSYGAGFAAARASPSTSFSHAATSALSR